MGGVLGRVGELTCQHGVEGELHVAHGVAEVGRPAKRRRTTTVPTLPAP
jgi:hypothetical protein